jgi:hypothetical protein
MTIFGLVLILVLLWAFLTYGRNIPEPLRMILYVVLVVLGLVLLIVLLQVLGVLPPIRNAPARVR